MPKLPTDQDLGIVPADASGRIASVSNAGAAGQATAQLGANVVQLGSTVLDVHDENAQAAADSAVWRGKVALDQKYRNDPDPATAPQRYNDELTNLVSQSAGGIIQPRIKTQFMDMVNRYVVARGVEMIQNQSDVALTNQAVAKLSDDGDAGVTAFAHSTDPRDQFGITQAYYGQVDAMVKARTLDATVGERLKKDFIRRAIYSNIANAGSPDEMIKRWNGFNGVETPEPPQGLGPAPSPSDGKVMPGQPHLDPSLAPPVPTGAARPLGMGEYVANPDGSTSNEITITVENPALNGGKPTVLPSLWVVGGKPITVNEDTAARYAKQSGLTFPSFANEADADKFTAAREATWQSIKPEDAGQVPPLWSKGAPSAGSDYRAAIIKGESGGDVSKVNPKSGAAGRYQFMPATAAQYGLTVADLTNPDPKVQAKVDVAFQKFTADNAKTLTTSLGHPPTAAELTLAHQQGAQGAAALLANPNASAVSIVGQKAVLDNGGEPSMTAQDFSQHVMGYYGASGAPGSATAPANENTPTAPTMANEPAPGSMASKVPADVYDTMLNGIQTELNRAQAQIDHRAAVDEKIKQQAADTAMTDYQQQMVMHAANPTGVPDVDMVKVSQDPRLKGDKTALPSLISFQKSLDHPPTDDTLDKATTAQLYRSYLNGTATTKDFQDAFAPPDNSPGKISKANFDFLMGAATSKDPDAKNINALKDAFLKNSDYAITHDPSGLTIDLPAAHDADFRFMTDFQRAWDAKVKAGQDPRGLITPGDKDYFGSQANMVNYIKTADQWLAEAQKAHDEANPPQPGFWDKVGDFLTPSAPATGFSNPAAAVPATPKVYRSAADLQGAINSGELSLPDAQAYGLAHGILKSKGAAAATPVAAAGPPIVPSGE